MQDLIDAISLEPEGAGFNLEETFAPFTRLEAKYGDPSNDKRVIAIAFSLYCVATCASYCTVLAPYSSFSIAYGSLMLARHLCGRGRGPFFDEESLQAMGAMDLLVQNEHRNLVTTVCSEDPEVSWKHLWRIDEFYGSCRDLFPPVPSTEEEYEAVPTEADYEAGREKRPQVNLLDFQSTVGAMFSLS